jgi:hypothetical protein
LTRVKAGNAEERLNNLTKVIAGWRKVLQPQKPYQAGESLRRLEKPEKVWADWKPWTGYTSRKVELQFGVK